MGEEKKLEVDNIVIEVEGLAWSGPQKDKKKEKKKKAEKVVLEPNDSFVG